MIFENVNNTILFSIISLVYMIFFAISFLVKKKIKSKELNIYKALIATNLVALILEISLAILIVVNSDSFIYFALKLFNMSIFSYVAIFTAYTYIYTHENHSMYKTIQVGYSIYYFVCLICMLALPIKLNDVAYMQYSYGVNNNFLFANIFILITLNLVFLIKNFNKLSIKKKVPIILLISLLSINAITQAFVPHILLANSILSIVTFIMYFTIENPDLKMITALNEAKEAADKANNAKSDFLSSMSHEIRTPLNAIVGFSHGLLESDLNDSAKEDVKNIIMASDSLLELVNGILDISKIEANKLEIIDTTYNFSKMFDELVLLTKARMGEKPLDFRYSYDESIPKYLYGDGSRVKQVILNLLTNSVKYTKEGYVDFKINSVIKDDVIRLIISVEDSGIGIKKESIDKLFTKFERLGVEKNTTTEGTGLGLAITKKLVEMMGGNVVVHSVFGKGSKFTVSLDQRFANEEEIKKLEVESKPVTNEEKIDASDKKVLVVDDNKLNLKVAERLLKPFNINVETIDNGTDCINKITSGNHYDLILLDDMMPKMSGTETMKKLREINGFDIPVVVLTANAIAGMKEKYISEGFDDYLSKPIEKTELNRVIKKYLN